MVIYSYAGYKYLRLTRGQGQTGVYVPLVTKGTHCAPGANLKSPLVGTEDPGQIMSVGHYRPDLHLDVQGHYFRRGVVIQSPFLALAEYERMLGLPVNYLNGSISARGSQSAWAKFERGELELLAFYEELGRELSDVASGNTWYTSYCNRKGLKCPPLPETLAIDGRELFGAMMCAAGRYDPHIRNAILHLRAAGQYKIIALTNNFGKVVISNEEAVFLGWKDGPTPNHLRPLFDDFCDSSTYGMRKPEPRFYLLACERNNIMPSEAVFLDDIRLNLKSARELGMTTIHVEIGKTMDAIRELEKIVGLDLTSPIPESKL